MRFDIAEPLGRAGLTRFSWLCVAGLAIVIPSGWISAWAWERDLRWFYLFLISFFISTMLVPVSIYLSLRLGVMDMPTERKMHTAATARLGGLAVFAAVLLTLARNYKWTDRLEGLILGAGLIYALGVVEDARGLSARARLAGQLTASVLVIAYGVRVTFVPHIPGEWWIEAAITTLWLVGITNAVNFLDGIDGLAAGLGLVCSALFLSIAWTQRDGALAYASAALAGACLGFLPYNWHKAKVFLGDAGATFIGFMLAGLAVIGTWAENNPVVAVATPLLILGVPLFDMTYTTVARIRRGAVRGFKEWLEYAGKDHFHHRLMKLGLKPPEAVGFVLMVNLALGLSALACHYSTRRLIPLLLLAQAFVLFMIVVVLMLLGREFSLPNDPEKSP